MLKKDKNFFEKAERFAYELFYKSEFCYWNLWNDKKYTLKSDNDFLGVWNKLSTLKNFGEAIDADVLPPAYCAIMQEKVNEFVEKDICKIVGDGSSNRYICLGVYPGEDSKGYVDRCGFYDEKHKIYKYSGDSKDNPIFSNEYPIPMAESKNFVFKNTQDFLLMFDTESQSPNFSENIVAMPCYMYSLKNTSRYVNGAYIDRIFDNGAGLFGTIVPESGVERKEFCFLTPQEVQDRAITIYQILSRFDYDKATDKDKELLYSLREKTISMLHDFYIGKVIVNEDLEHYDDKLDKMLRKKALCLQEVRRIYFSYSWQLVCKKAC